MKLYSQAVTLALQENLLDEAKQFAKNVEEKDLTQSKKLWL